MMKKIAFFVLLSILLTSCVSNEEKKAKAKRDSIAIVEQKKIDSVNAIKKWTKDSITQIQNRIADSIYQIKKVKEEAIAKKKELEEQRKWDNSKAGKIQKKHPDWSRDDCQLVADRKIWIGMDIQMVVAQRGLPNHKNVSNYGNGNEYQYCWDDYDISCFYTKADQIVYSYN